MIDGVLDDTQQIFICAQIEQNQKISGLEVAWWSLDSQMSE